MCVTGPTYYRGARVGQSCAEEVGHVFRLFLGLAHGLLGNV